VVRVTFRVLISLFLFIFRNTESVFVQVSFRLDPQLMGTGELSVMGRQSDLHYLFEELSQIFKSNLLLSYLKSNLIT